MLSKFERKFGKDRPWGGHRRVQLPLKRAALYIGVILAAMAVVGIALIICDSIKISAVSVEGVSIYTADDVVNVAELYAGGGYWDFDTSRTEDELMEKMPYIKDVKVRRHLNGSVSITVTEESNLYYTRHNLNYYAISGDTWLVKIADSEATNFINLGAVYLDLPSDAKIRVGEKLSFEYGEYVEGTAEIPQEEITTHEGDANEYYEYVFEVIDAVNESEFKEGVSHIGVSDVYGIYIALGGNVKIVLGTTDELERKLDSAYIIYANSYGTITSTGFVGGVIEASDPAKATFREKLDLVLPK